MYSGEASPASALKNIGKRARIAIEETGVNIAYMAFGFINWTEHNGTTTFRAPDFRGKLVSARADLHKNYR